jgi:hypothetical protein
VLKSGLGLIVEFFGRTNAPASFLRQADSTYGSLR